MILLLTALLTIGTFLLLAGSIALPSLRERRLIRSYGRPKRKGFEEKIVLPIARRLAGYVKLPAEYRAELGKTLEAVGYTMTPEVYIARIVTASLLFLLLSVVLLVCGMNLPAAVLLVTAVILAIRMTGEAGDKLKRRNRRIEAELPQFMSTISQTLRYNRDLQSIVDQYRQVAGPELCGQLDILLTDMQTGSQKQALLHFADRLRIDYLTSFVSGLVSEAQGYDQTDFLKTTERDMRKLSLERLRTEANRKPGRLRFAQLLLVISIAAVWFVALAFTSLSGLNALTNF